MSRLIDDLRAPGAKLVMPYFVLPEKEHAWGQLAARLQELLMNPELPVLLIDPVADYYFSSEQEFWDLRDDFPNLAPPYPAFWCECKMAKRIHSKEKGDSDLAAMVPHGRVGVLIHGVSPADVEGTGIPANARWILWCELYIDFGRRGITADGPHGTVFVCVDANGAIVSLPQMQSFAGEEHAPIMKSYITWLYPAFLAICFMHCKNVTVVENRVPPPLAKKYQARHGIRPTNYKTLVIEPLKNILRTEGRSDHVGVQKAIHICRGHFRDYREGRGLFGKYRQLVWMPSIVRGTKGEKAPPREVEVKV
jgi:hypothetical protein